jgi:hypothetical protein
MSERDLGNSLTWWVGEVVNVYDPWESGRVQVRVYGRHDDKTNIPDEVLPWAQPMQSSTSAAFGRMGSAPVGLVKGSRVMGIWMDSDQLYPIILGSMAKAGDYKSGTTEGGNPQLDNDTSALPIASQASIPSDSNIRSGLSNPAATSIKDIDQAKDPDANNKVSKRQASGDVDGMITAINKKLGPTKNKPTTAASTKPPAPGKTSDVQNIIKEVDPSALSASLPNVNKAFTTVRDQIQQFSPAGIINNASNALTNALAALSSSLGIDGVLNAIGGAFAAPSILGAFNMSILGSAALGLMALGASSSSGSGRGSTVSAVNPPPMNQATPYTHKPPENLIVTIDKVPTTYIKQYYEYTVDPFPGYIVWLGPTGDYLYTIRDEPNYTSAAQELAFKQGSTAHQAFGGKSPTPDIFASVISGIVGGMLSGGLSSLFGGGVNLGSMLGFSQSFIPSAGISMNNVVALQMVGAVASKTGITNTLNAAAAGLCIAEAGKKEIQKALKKTPSQEDKEYSDAYRDLLAQKLAMNPNLQSISGTITLPSGATSTVTVSR